MNRRRFLERSAVPLMAGFIPIVLRSPTAGLSILTPPTPDAAFRELAAGNQRFAANRPTEIERDLANRRARTVDKQQPFAAILGCSDSRVPLELVFDQSIGELFVARVAGNLATPEVIASIEYAVAELGVHAVLVLGHANCGAVKAALKTDDVPGQISALYSHIRPAIASANGDLEQAVAANARFQAELLRTSSTVIRDALAKRTIDVRSAVYQLATGRVTFA